MVSVMVRMSGEAVWRRIRNRIRGPGKGRCVHYTFLLGLWGFLDPIPGIQGLGSDLGIERNCEAFESVLSDLPGIRLYECSVRLDGMEMKEASGIVAYLMRPKN